MPILPSHLVSLDEIEAEVCKAVSKLGPEVLRVRYHVGEDHDGDPAVYFRIVVRDSAARRESIGHTTQHVRNVLTAVLQPYKWGLIPYFSFRSESEQARLREPEWS